MRKYNDRVRRNTDYWKPEKFKHYKTLKELAVAVGKDPSWLRKLEHDGRIPRPATVKRGKLYIRLYSPENEVEIRKILATMKPGPLKQC